MTFTMLYNHHRYFQNSSSSRAETLCPRSKASQASSLLPQVTSILLPVSVRVPALGTSCQWDHAILSFRDWLSQSTVFPR